MSWDQIRGSWRESRGTLKEQWGKLTDDDLDRIDGKRDQLLGTLQQRYGKAKDVLEREVRDFEHRVTTAGAVRSRHHGDGAGEAMDGEREPGRRGVGMGGGLGMGGGVERESSYAAREDEEYHG